MRNTRRPAALLRPLIVTAALLTAATAVTGCGGGSGDGSGSGSGSGSDKNAASYEKAGDLVKEVNKAMRETAFHGSGTSTALGGGTQETWSDPEQGLRMKSSGKAGSGEIYCKGGKNFISAPLLATSVEQSGQKITVPDRLADVYVTNETGQGCDAYYRIDESATFAKDKNAEVDGEKTVALTISVSGTSDTYHVAAEGTPYLLRMDSVRDGLTSTTTYGKFGQRNTITVPSETMPMDEFRKQVMGG
ncbi:hypothetical protein [Streptomyces corynorhini]|uniref:Lipoprotein n=1 Tax=Streptomyces corynorhini TaxID=2282652 RepID=A0A370B8Q8_9ACTN|nr:hypothetical protein [Streptomyces corynorhini]RDG36514.1 hypothetical protein DVH02_19420 [Streptomyces corynorhini]